VAGNSYQQVNNFPAADPPPPSPGHAHMDAPVAADGGPTMSTVAILRFTVDQLPTNGNRLFLVCNLLLPDESQRTAYYAKASVANLGPLEYTLQFGASTSLDPALIGTTRLCGIVSANPTAAETLAYLMKMDADYVEFSPIDGHDLVLDRRSLPDGSFFVSNQAAVTIQRLT
jgi:hypothetical protein